MGEKKIEQTKMPDRYELKNVLDTPTYWDKKLDKPIKHRKTENGAVKGAQHELKVAQDIEARYTALKRMEDEQKAMTDIDTLIVEATSENGVETRDFKAKRSGGSALVEMQTHAANVDDLI